MIRLTWLWLIAAGSIAFAQDMSILEREMARVSVVGGGKAGAAVIHLETGRRAGFNAFEFFPMASAYKIPIAVELLDRVDRGADKLERMVTIEKADFHPGSGTLTQLFNPPGVTQPGVALSLRHLLELMLLISDNSATDVLLREVGGAEVVNARLKALGVGGIRIDGPTITMIRESRQRMQYYSGDPKDGSTPEGMAQLLAKIHRREALKAETTELLLDILRRCSTGNARLKGLLPEGTVVRHKTGTLNGVANDVGFIELPNGAGTVAIAVFVKESEVTPEKRERAIAEIGRAAHDFFLFHPVRGARLDYSRMAYKIVSSLKPNKGERVLAPIDPRYFEGLADELKRQFTALGVTMETVELARSGTGSSSSSTAPIASALGNHDILLELPYRTSRRQVTAADRAAIVKWLDQGGTHRAIHFHWDQGSVIADGLAGAHSPDLDGIYQEALEVDGTAVSAAMDKSIAMLRSGVTRITTQEGTDISFRVGDRPFNKQDGDASLDRMKNAKVRVDREIELPVGVMRVAPLEDTVNGKLVIPYARLDGAVAAGITLTFVKGKLTAYAAVENEEALKAFLDKGGEGARAFREVGLGFNPRLAAMQGGILPYFAYGTGMVRMSLGDNEEIGGAVRGGFRRWFFFPNAKVEVKGKTIW